MNNRKKRDKEAEELLLKQLAAMSMSSENENRSVKSESVYGQEYLQELERKKELRKLQRDENTEFYNPNLHNNIQRKFEKNLKATQIITGYIARKNEKNLRKEEMMEDYVSVTDNQTLNQSRILNGSVFDDFDDDFKEELLQIKKISEPIMSRNQISDMRMKVQEEMKIYKENNPEIFDSGIFEKKEQEMANSSLVVKNNPLLGANIGNLEIEELNRSLELDLEIRRKEMQKDQEFIDRQRERFAMAEEDRRSMILREMYKAKEKAMIKDQILSGFSVQRNFEYEVKENFGRVCQKLDDYVMRYPVVVKMPKSEITKQEILRVEKGSEKILNEIRFLYQAKNVGGAAGYDLKGKRGSLEPISGRGVRVGGKEGGEVGKRGLNIRKDGKVVRVSKEDVGGDEVFEGEGFLGKIFRKLELDFEKKNLMNRVKENFLSLQKAYSCKEIMHLSALFPRNSLIKRVTIEELDFSDDANGVNFSLEFGDIMEEVDRGKMVQFVVKLEKIHYIQDLLSSIPIDHPVTIMDCNHNEMKDIFKEGQEEKFEENKLRSSIIELDVSNNLYSSLNGFTYFSRLCFLNCSSNKILSLPTQEIKFLQALNLSNNQIASMAGISNISSLRILNLSANYITRIDEEIENLAFLEKLDLSRNKITKLENLNRNIFLQTVILYGNEIEEIGGDVEIFSLEELHLSDNKISSLEGNWMCPNLKLLNLKNNRLSYVRKDRVYIFENLKILDLAFNPLPIEDFDVLLKNCPNLSILDYYGKKSSNKKDILNLIDKRLNLLAKLNDEPYNPKHQRETDLGGFNTQEKISKSKSIFNSKENKAKKMQKRFWYLKGKFESILKLSGSYSSVSLKQKLVNPNIDYLQRQQSKIVPLLFMSHFYILKSIFDSTEAKMENVLKIKKTHCEKNKAKVDKVVRRLREYAVKWKRRRDHFKRNEGKLVHIQKIFRGHRVRREMKGNSDWKMAQMRAIGKMNLEKLIKMQSLARGFITRRRFKRLFKDLKFEVETDMADSEVENFFEDDLDLDKGLNVPSNIFDFFETKFQNPPEIAQVGPPQGDSMTKSTSSLNSKKSFRIGNIRIDSSDLNSTSSAKTDNSDNVSVLTMESKIEKIESKAQKMPKLKIKKKMNKSKLSENKRTLDIIEEWGFKNEAAKKALEFKLAKERRRKIKAKKLTAQQRFNKFLKKAKHG